MLTLKFRVFFVGWTIAIVYCSTFVCTESIRISLTQRRSCDQSCDMSCDQCVCVSLFHTGVDVVLGHISKTNEGDVPIEQQLCRYRHSPGSGILVVELMADGPTRVLSIRDKNKKVTHTHTLSLSHTHTHTHTHSLTHTHTHSLTLFSLSLSLSHTHTHSLTLFLSLSLSHTHTL